MRVYDWKSSDTRDIVVCYTFGEGWFFHAETKSATDYLNKLSGPDFKWAFVKNLDDGILTTENKSSFDMIYETLKGTNFVVDLHLGESAWERGESK
ncbi:MAG: hypothetical protein Unbinned2026contig1000_12 [Prokaryotic dsDNA virus sp.]|nr:MAG: hypothetical protein Unbinned2026contig1000_12 [Prokaryotic dsDNA virus sp.]|tara:strand:- start:6239 stop:6526 length:288 start_codon:yes stop_codon:yes gene_type:complete